MTSALRNVALRQSFFHNGVTLSLRDVVAFYAGRDVAPQEWYPPDREGGVRKFDDLPTIYHDNINKDRRSTGMPATKPHSRSRRSKISSVSCKP